MKLEAFRLRPDMLDAVIRKEKKVTPKSDFLAQSEEEEQARCPRH